MIFWHDFFLNNGGAEEMVINLAMPDDVILSIAKKNDRKSCIKSLINANRDSNMVRIILLVFTLLFKKFNSLVFSNQKKLFISGFFWVYFIDEDTLKEKDVSLYFHHPPKFKLRGFIFGSYFSKYLNRVLIRKIKERQMHIDRFFCNSFYTRRNLIAAGLPDARVVFPRVSKKWFAFRHMKPFLKKDRSYVISFERLEKYKNIDYFLDLSFANPDIDFVVASTGRYRRQFEARYGNRPNITFVGYLSSGSLIGLVSNAMASFHLAADEDFGMSCLASLVVGTRVVCVDDGGYTEIVREFGNGWLIEKDRLTESLNLVMGNLKKTNDKFDYFIEPTGKIDGVEKRVVYRSEVFFSSSRTILVQAE